MAKVILLNNNNKTAQLFKFIWFAFVGGAVTGNFQLL